MAPPPEPQREGWRLREDPQRIMVVKPSSLGDVVHTLPAVALVRKRWPGAKLRWLVNSEWAPLLQGNPHLDEIVEFPRSQFRGAGALGKLLPWARQLRQGYSSDLVLDFQGLLRSALLSRGCAGPGAPICGLSDAREGAGFFYHRTADVRGRTHAVDRYLALVEALGIAIPSPGALAWDLPAGEPPASAASLLPGYILLHPYSRGKGKSLSLADTAAFCEAVAPHPVVIAGRADLPSISAPNVIDLLNRTTIPELLWLIRRARWTVSVDSGPMHMAAAISSRLVSIHTWSDPAKVGPYRPGAWVWKDGRFLQMHYFLGLDQHAAPRQISDMRGLAAQVMALAAD